MTYLFMIVSINFQVSAKSFFDPSHFLFSTIMNNWATEYRMTDCFTKSEIYQSVLYDVFTNTYNIQNETINIAKVITTYLLGIDHQQHKFCTSAIDDEKNNQNNKPSQMDVDEEDDEEDEDDVDVDEEPSIPFNLFTAIHECVKEEEQKQKKKDDETKATLCKLLQQGDDINITLKLVPNDAVFKDKIIKTIQNQFDSFTAEKIGTLDLGKDVVYFTLKDQFKQALPLVILTSTVYSPMVTVAQYPALNDNAFLYHGMITYTQK